MFEIKHVNTKLLSVTFLKIFSKRLKIKKISIIDNNKKTELPV